MAAKSTNRPRAHSYLRFSTPEQAQGDSFRRQTEAASDYATRHGLDLDTELTFRDLGVSAFRGANATEGALAAFIDAVDKGKVAPGSYLLVENLDRLSRDRIMPALSRFSALLEKGVTVVTLSDQKVYTAESLNNLPDLMLSLLVMSRAHEESKTKGERVRAAWANKKQRAANGKHVLTAKAPGWLRVKGGSFEVIEDRAAVVRRIFKMTLEGHGKAAIARRLNTDGVSTFGTADGWHASYIQKILRNESVVGRFQPMKLDYAHGKRQRVPDGEPIENYFPRVIDDADFYRVKHSKPGISGKGKSLPRNALSGIVFCARCGGPMHWVNKGPSPKGGAYLACDNARRKKTCDAPAVRYDPVLNHVLGSLHDILNVYPQMIPSAQETDSKIDAIAAELSKTEEAIARLVDTLERVPSATIEKRLAEHERRLAVLKAEKIKLEERAVINRTAGNAVDDFIRWYNQPVAPEQFGDVMLGAIAHMSAQIKMLVERVEIEKGKPIRIIAVRAA